MGGWPREIAGSRSESGGEAPSSRAVGEASGCSHSYANGGAWGANPVGEEGSAGVGRVIFREDGKAAAEDYVKRDPYVANGVVTDWRIRPWNVAVGG